MHTPTPLTAIVDLLELQHLDLAPDASRVAYSVSPAGQVGERHLTTLHVIPTNGDSTPTDLTDVEAHYQQPTWSPDGSRLAVLADRDEAGRAQIWLLTPGLTNPQVVSALPAGVRAFAWSPDGRTLACTGLRTASPDRSAAIVVDDEPRAALWLIDVATGAASARIVSPDGWHVGGYVSRGFEWLPDGSGLIVLAGRSARTNDRIRSAIYHLALDGAFTHIADVEGATRDPLPSPDGTALALIAADGHIPARWALQVMPLGGGASRLVLPDFDGTVDGVTWLSDSQRVVAQISVHQESKLATVDTETGDVQWHPQPNDARGEMIGNASIRAKAYAQAYGWASDTSAGDIWFRSTRPGAEPILTRLTDLNPWLREQTLGEVRQVAWAASDGMQIEGVLILPVGYTDGAVPLMTHIHGGPAGAWTHRCYLGWHDWGQMLAQRGMAVFLPNPRGSTGRGSAFLSAIVDSYGEPDLHDILAGIDHLVTEGIADPKRLVVGGWSGGGYLTNRMITHDAARERFRCAIAGAGVSNWISFLGTADIRDVFSRYVTEPAHDPEPAWALSPVRLISQVSTPTLYLQGEADPRVPVGQSFEMYAGLRVRGVETQMVLYPGARHDIFMRGQQLDLLERVIRWYCEHLDLDPLLDDATSA